MTRKSVKGSNMLSVMRKQFRQAPDHRDLSRITYKLKGILMCGVAMFSFKTPSLLQFEEMSREDSHRTNLKSIFDIDGVPSDTQFRDVLDEVTIEINEGVSASSSKSRGNLLPIQFNNNGNLEALNDDEKQQLLNAGFVLVEGSSDIIVGCELTISKTMLDPDTKKCFTEFKLSDANGSTILTSTALGRLRRGYLCNNQVLGTMLRSTGRWREHMVPATNLSTLLRKIVDESGKVPPDLCEYLSS